MSDLSSQYYGEQSQSSDSTPYDNIQDFQTWSAIDRESLDLDDPEVMENGLQDQYLRYAEYQRSELTLQGKYDIDAETSIAQGLAGALIGKGMVSEGDQEGFHKIYSQGAKVSNDTKYQTVLESINRGGIQSEAISKFEAVKNTWTEEAMANDPELAAKFEDYKAKAFEAANTNYNASLRADLDAGVIPAARIEDSEGNSVLETSRTYDHLTAEQALFIGREKGNLTSRDLLELKGLKQEVHEGVSLAKRRRYDDTSETIHLMSEDNQVLKDMMEEHAKLSKSLANGKYDEKGGFFSDIVTHDKAFYEARLAKVTEDIAGVINRSGKLRDGETLDVTDIDNAMSKVSLNSLANSGQLDLHEAGSKRVGDNLHRTKYGEIIMNSKAMANRQTFDATIDAHQDLSKQEKSLLEAQRVHYLQSSFAGISEALFNEEDISGEWGMALSQGRAEGKENYEIASEFLADSNNFSYFSSSVGAVGESIADAFSDLAGAAMVMTGLGEETGRNILLENNRERAERAELENLFGHSAGIGRDIMTTIAPMLVDVGATTLLSMATAPAAGIGGAAFLTAKATASASAKKLARTLTLNSMSKGASAAARDAMQTGVTKQVRAGLTYKAFREANQATARKVGLVPAVFLPAANRSAGSTYAAVYQTLKQQGGMTDEQIHDKALGAGLTAGAVTGLITSAFGFLGKGGVESALTSNMTRGQVKKALGKMVGKDAISDATLNRVIKQKMAEAIGKHTKLAGFKSVLSNARDEAQEEALDEFINGIIVGANTGEDFDIVKSVQQSAHAALIGGIMGGGTPIIKKVGSPIFGNGASDPAEVAAVRSNFISSVTSELNESGSPITANVVGSILQARGRKRDAAVKQHITDPIAANEARIESTQKAKQHAEKYRQAMENLGDDWSPFGTTNEAGPQLLGLPAPMLGLPAPQVPDLRSTEPDGGYPNNIGPDAPPTPATFDPENFEVNDQGDAVNSDGQPVVKMTQGLGGQNVVIAGTPLASLSTAERMVYRVKTIQDRIAATVKDQRENGGAQRTAVRIHHRGEWFNHGTPIHKLPAGAIEKHNRILDIYSKKTGIQIPHAVVGQIYVPQGEEGYREPIGPVQNPHDNEVPIGPDKKAATIPALAHYDNPIGPNPKRLPSGKLVVPPTEESNQPTQPVEEVTQAEFDVLLDELQEGDAIDMADGSMAVVTSTVKTNYQDGSNDKVIIQATKENQEDLILVADTGATLAEARQSDPEVVQQIESDLNPEPAETVTENEGETEGAEAVTSEGETVEDLHDREDTLIELRDSHPEVLAVHVALAETRSKLEAAGENTKVEDHSDSISKDEAAKILEELGNTELTPEAVDAAKVDVPEYNFLHHVGPEASDGFIDASTIPLDPNSTAVTKRQGKMQTAEFANAEAHQAATISAVEEAIKRGFPIVPNANNPSGIPRRSKKSGLDWDQMGYLIQERIETAYPKRTVPEASADRYTTEPANKKLPDNFRVQYDLDQSTGVVTRLEDLKSIELSVDPQGVAFFTNNPVDAYAALAKGVPMRVPKNSSNINPAIVIEGDRVVAIIKADKKGILMKMDGKTATPYEVLGGAALERKSSTKSPSKKVDEEVLVTTDSGRSSELDRESNTWAILSPLAKALGVKLTGRYVSDTAKIETTEEPQSFKDIEDNIFTIYANTTKNPAAWGRFRNFVKGRSQTENPQAEDEAVQTVGMSYVNRMAAYGIRSQIMESLGDNVTVDGETGKVSLTQTQTNKLRSWFIQNSGMSAEELASTVALPSGVAVSSNTANQLSEEISKDSSGKLADKVIDAFILKRILNSPEAKSGAVPDINSIGDAVRKTFNSYYNSRAVGVQGVGGTKSLDVLTEETGKEVSDTADEVTDDEFVESSSSTIARLDLTSDNEAFGTETLSSDALNFTEKDKTKESRHALNLIEDLQQIRETTPKGEVHAAELKVILREFVRATTINADRAVYNFMEANNDNPVIHQALRNLIFNTSKANESDAGGVEDNTILYAMAMNALASNEGKVTSQLNKQRKESLKVLVDMGVDSAALNHIVGFYSGAPHDPSIYTEAARNAADGGVNIFGGSRFDTLAMIYRVHKGADADAMPTEAILPRINAGYAKASKNATNLVEMGLDPKSRAKEMVAEWEDAARGNVKINRALADNDLTPAELQAAVEQNNQRAEQLGLESGDSSTVVAALRSIVEDPEIPQHNKLVAKLLLEDPKLISEVKFTIGNFGEAMGVAGYQTVQKNGKPHVVINLDQSNGRGLDNVILEEYVHASLVEVLNPDANTTAGQQRAIRELDGLRKLALKAAKQLPNKDSKQLTQYILTDMDEFVAHFMLNPEFQAFMKHVTVPRGQRGLFRRMVRAITNMFRKAFGADLTQNESATYSKALENILDLTKSVNRSRTFGVVDTITHMATDSVNGIEGSPQLMDESHPLHGFTPPSRLERENQVAQQLQETSNTGREMTVEETQQIDESLQDIVSNSSFATVHNPSESNSEVKNRVMELMTHARHLVPANITMVSDTSIDSTALAVGDTIYVNPKMLAESVDGLDMEGAKAITASIMSEEVAHVASYNLLTDEDITQIGEELGNIGLERAARAYYSTTEEADAAIERLNSEDADVSKGERDNLVEEHLRSLLQKSTRGFTTEEDYSFYIGNPTALDVLFRYLSAALKKIAHNMGSRLNKNNPIMQQAVNNMVAEVRSVKAGRRSVLSHTLAFDPSNPMANFDMFENMISEPIVGKLEREMGQDTYATRKLATSVKNASKIMQSDLDFDNFFDKFEFPWVFHGTEGYEYNSPFPNNNNAGLIEKTKDKIKRWVVGDVDPRIDKLKTMSELSNSQATDIALKFKTAMDKIILRDFGSMTGTHNELIAKAVGNSEGVKVDKAVLDGINDRHDRDMVALNKTKDTLTDTEYSNKVEVITLRKQSQLRSAETKAANALRADRERALKALAKQSPELVEKITQIREQLIDPLSKLVKDQYGVDGDLGFTIDTNLGLYITRSYRMFTDVGYADKVMNRGNGEYAAIRERAIEYFENTYISNAVAEIKDKNPNMTDQQAKAKAESDLTIRNSGVGMTYGATMVEAFFSKYGKGESKTSIAVEASKNELKTLVGNLKDRVNIPEEIRDLMGEHGAEGNTDGLIRTFTTLSTMASQQSFLNNIVRLGRDPNIPAADRFIVTKEEIKAAKDEGGTEGYHNYVPLKFGDAAKFSPFKDMYAPKELADGLAAMFAQGMFKHAVDSTADVTAKTVGKFAVRATGAAMGAKTLGSLGFYSRNVFGNVLFFGPAQGFWSGTPSAMSDLIKSTWGIATNNDDQFDARINDLIGLGIVNNSTEMDIVKKLISGEMDVRSAKQEFERMMQDIETGEKVKGAVKGAFKGANEARKTLIAKASALGAAVDNFYKIAYFEHELATLEKAVDADPAGGRLSMMSKAQLKREAARKVLMTAQSATETPKIVTKFTQSSLGVLLAPFFRFRAEVVRIGVNTPKLAWEELRSGNPVLARRGAFRMGGFVTMTAGVSAAAPTVLSALLAGFGLSGEEEEALKSGIPEYLKSHQFTYWRKPNGDLWSADLTYMNPFGMYIDPLTIAFKSGVRGEWSKALETLANGFVKDLVLDPQILAGAVSDVLTNTNARDGKPIYEDASDDAGEKAFKAMHYIFENAFQPDIYTKTKLAWGAAGVDSDEVTLDETPIGILSMMALPMKPHKVDVDKSFRSFLFASNSEMSNVKNRMGRILSDKPMSTDTVEGIYEDRVEDMLAVDSDVYSKIQGFKLLGMSDSMVYQNLRTAGIGKRRSFNLMNGQMDRPILTPDFMQKLAETRFGPERSKTYFNKIVDYDPILKLDTE